MNTLQGFRALLLPVVALLAGAALGQPLPSADPSIERLYRFPLINGRSPASPAMSPDGRHIVFGWNRTGERKLDVWMMDFPGGEKRQIIKASEIVDLPRQDDARTEDEKKEQELYDGGIGGFQWAPDGKEFLFSYKGRVWTAKPNGDDLEPLVDAGDGMYNVSYSPDGKYIAYERGANIFRYDRKSGRIKQLTFISKPNTTLEGYEWSPDGQQIAVSWTDNSKLGRHVMMDFSKDRATVVNIQRMWNGELSVDQQIGVVPTSGGLVKFIGDLPRYMWVKQYEWSPDSKNLAIAWIKDDFKEFTISVAPADTLKKVDVYHEKAPSNYIPDWRPIVWSRDSKSILFGTDILDGRFGFRSILKMDADGKNLSKVFAERYDVASLYRPKKSDRIFLSTLSRSPLRSEITILEPDGKRTVHVVVENGMSTPKQFDDMGNPLVSEDGKRVASLASDRTMNPELFAVEPREARLTESQTEEFKKIKWADIREITYPGPDGVPIHALLITKPGLDMSVKHPALVSNIYANSGKAAWNGFFENYAAMNLDMVVLCVDFRASWGYGGEFNSGYYQKMGLIDVDEAVGAQKYLASLPYVRGDRVGIWGWSYGGYLTCMTMLTKPGVFDTGVAVASVTDWKSYNEWYTRRRLGLVKDDAAIFEKTSPITYASGLQGNLLLVHGMLDDNVLFQDTARLMQKLIDNGKYFDEMSYPRDDHGIGKDTSRPHVYATILRYLYQKLSRP